MSVAATAICGLRTYGGLTIDGSKLGRAGSLKISGESTASPTPTPTPPAFDQEVADETARLSLTGISVGWKVKQTYDGNIYQYTPSGIESYAGATVSGVGIAGVYKNQDALLTLIGGGVARFLIYVSHDGVWTVSDADDGSGSEFARSDTDADFPWNADWTTSGATVTRRDEAGTNNWTQL